MEKADKVEEKEKYRQNTSITERFWRTGLFLTRISYFSSIDTQVLYWCSEMWMTAIFIDDAYIQVNSETSF